MDPNNFEDGSSSKEMEVDESSEILSSAFQVGTNVVLLTHIFDLMKPEELFNLRLVNHVWDHIIFPILQIKHTPVKIQGDEKDLRSFCTIYNLIEGEKKRTIFTKFEIQLSYGSIDDYQEFLEHFGTSITYLILSTKYRDVEFISHATLHSEEIIPKALLILNQTPNLKKLNLTSFPQQMKLTTEHFNGLAEKFPNLRELEVMSIPSIMIFEDSGIYGKDFSTEICQRSPNLELLKFLLIDYDPIHAREQLSLYLNRKEGYFMPLLDITAYIYYSYNVVLEDLINLKSKIVKLSINSDVIYEEEHQDEDRLHKLQFFTTLSNLLSSSAEWITDFYLKDRDVQMGTELEDGRYLFQLPNLTKLKSCRLKFHYWRSNTVKKINPGQLPSLRISRISTKDEYDYIYADIIYDKVIELIVSLKTYRPKEFTFHIMFPNLTIFECTDYITIQLLNYILTNLRNLQELRLKFPINWMPHTFLSLDSWSVLTGSTEIPDWVAPTETSPLKKEMKVSDISLTNLRALKRLKLNGCSLREIEAIVHLTQTNRLQPLQYLKIICHSVEIAHILQKHWRNYLDILKSYHSKVILTGKVTGRFF